MLLAEAASQIEPVALGGLLRHFMAETLLVFAIPVILFVDLMVGKERRDEAATKLGLLALCAAFFLALFQSAPGNGDVAALFRADALAKVFRVIAIATGMVAAVLTLRGGDLRRGRSEFFVLLIGAVLGACLTAAANDLAMLYLAVETLSICGYLLAGIKKEDLRGSEAAMKYVLFGAVSSGFMLYGISLLYGFAGTCVIASPDGSMVSLASRASSVSGSPAFLIAIVMVVAGFAYKIAAAPFQFWCPDVYEGSPTPVAAFLAVASKGAGFAALLRVAGAVTGGSESFSEQLTTNSEHFRAVLIVMGVVTITIGNVAALRQNNSKRLLAYSAIAHAGYLLLGVAVTTTAGASAVIVYMVIYLFMTLGAFYLVGLVERDTGRTDVDAFEGLGYRSPWLAACMTLFLISLTGLPPTAGFVGKFFIFKEVFAYSGAHGSDLFFWCGVIGLLNAPIGLFYYMRFAKVMYLCDQSRLPERTSVRFTGLDKGLIYAVAVPVLVLGIFFGGLLDLASQAARGIFQ
ncbi:MAG: NADH-quinone oxidoreductase subunit N [Planctomycetota bacterium]|jgi:NADH-quinone oxidoreductase subunit N